MSAKVLKRKGQKDTIINTQDGPTKKPTNKSDEVEDNEVGISGWFSKITAKEEEEPKNKKDEKESSSGNINEWLNKPSKGAKKKVVKPTTNNTDAVKSKNADVPKKPAVNVKGESKFK